jgi:hypothetical protein
MLAIWSTNLEMFKKENPLGNIMEVVGNAVIENTKK